MAMIGNRWSTALLGAAFLGATRFGEFEQRMGAPPPSSPNASAPSATSVSWSKPPTRNAPTGSSTTSPKRPRLLSRPRHGDRMGPPLVPSPRRPRPPPHPHPLPPHLPPPPRVRRMRRPPPRLLRPSGPRPGCPRGMGLTIPGLGAAAALCPPCRLLSRF
jgi:hypothetical protein